MKINNRALLCMRDAEGRIKKSEVQRGEAALRRKVLFQICKKRLTERRRQGIIDRKKAARQAVKHRKIVKRSEI